MRALFWSKENEIAKTAKTPHADRPPEPRFKTPYPRKPLSDDLGRALIAICSTRLRATASGRPQAAAGSRRTPLMTPRR